MAGDYSDDRMVEMIVEMGASTTQPGSRTTQTEEACWWCLEVAAGGC